MKRAGVLLIGASALLISLGVTNSGCGGGDDSSSSQDAGPSNDATALDSGDGGNGADGGSDSGHDAGCTGTNSNVDEDGDGFTPAQGDCNDCDPRVNPGAIDVVHASLDGGAPFATDDDCDGTAGDNVDECDTGLPLADLTATNGAKALDLCRASTETTKTWGVIDAQYIRADGTTFSSPGVQVGVQPSFGPNIHVQSGEAMLMLSSGHARSPDQTGACGTDSCAENVGTTPPTGFPQPSAGCTFPATISDDVGIALKLRAPTNAVGYAFDYRFFSFDFPAGVCGGVNDELVAIASPAPTDATNGNVVMDSTGKPMGPDEINFFSCCDPTASATFASACTGTCPSLPSPYCPSGTSDLAGTGFDTWGSGASKFGGATSWLQTTAPVTAGSEFTLDFLIWDSVDQNGDSSVLIDNFHWITSGTVTVGTNVLASPK